MEAPKKALAHQQRKSDECRMMAMTTAHECGNVPFYFFFSFRQSPSIVNSKSCHMMFVPTNIYRQNMLQLKNNCFSMKIPIFVCKRN